MKTIYLTDAQMRGFSKRAEARYPFIRRDYQAVYSAALEGIWRVDLQNDEDAALARGAYASVLKMSEKETEALREIIWEVRNNPLTSSTIQLPWPDLEKFCDKILKTI